MILLDLRIMLCIRTRERHSLVPLVLTL